ncbi:MAG: glutathione S-transferase family protein [Gammaproteobacteria bacterium]|nr:glutathione S-transferase family protein [Gammaproteobacteria bacterium]
MKPKLISYKLCPYVQRAVIALIVKAIDYDIEYIDLARPPEWFLRISPFKKVPLLLVGEHVIFESAIINEYLDEAYPNRLHPADLLTRATHRGWIEFGNNCMPNAFQLTVKPTEQEFDDVLSDLQSKFDQLETVVDAAPYFSGADFSLVDASYAPLFQRLRYLDELRPGIFDRARHPKINRWSDQLLQLSAVQQSCVPDIKALYYEQLRKRQGFAAQFLPPLAAGVSVAKSVY